VKQISPTRKLIPLKAGQEPVTGLPKFTTDLPFFYLTKKKELLTQTIQYEGADTEGRPIRWRVTPNTHPAIGAPGIEAHEVWVRLLRPAIDARKTSDGNLGAIIPLGRVRECLRMIGWDEGGWEARDLFKAIRQIGTAWCEVDFWLPTTDVDDNGQVLFKRIKGEFSRMSIYAIGSKHVTEADLQQGSVAFDFDPDDTVYVQLHPLEVEMQRHQPQRLVDNEYLFSVNPSARRWYELIAPKIFGVVKNKGEFCEVRYSWYIKHHPTLKRYYERKRVVFQMTRLIADHLALGYVKKVEFRPIKEQDKEIDYIIRYYPGEAATQSVSRVLSHTYRKPLRLVKREEQLSPAQTRTQSSSLLAGEQGSKHQEDALPAVLPTWTEKELNLIRQLNEQFEVAIIKAGELVRKSPEETERQLIAWPYRKDEKIENQAGFIISAIEQAYSPPKTYLELQEKEDARGHYEVRQAAVAACAYCRDSNGWRFTDKGARECTHTPDIEAKLPTK
jgi:hypothetical protein